MQQLGRIVYVALLAKGFEEFVTRELYDRILDRYT